MTDRSANLDLRVAETDRLWIRRYLEDDLAELHALLSDPRAMAFWPEPFNQAQTESWIRRANLHYRIFGLGRWAVILKSSGRLIGDCGLVPQKIEGVATHDIGWIIHPSDWNRGYATEAAAACKRIAFDELLLDHLFANMPADHAACIRVAEKIGMRRQTVFQNPRNRSILTCLYGAARTDSPV